MFNVIKPQILTTSAPIAIVVSQFNCEITSRLAEGTIRRLTSCGIASEDILVVEVPGAIEIPLVIQQIAHGHQYKAIIALGAIIRGETTHYDYVCDQVSQGCQKVMLDTGIPVVFGVLTTEDEEQAFARTGGVHGHKGEDAADCAIAMISVLQQCCRVSQEKFGFAHADQ